MDTLISTPAAAVAILTPPQGSSLLSYVETHRRHLLDLLEHHGGLLLRGLPLAKREELSQLNEILYGNVLQYRGGISPRNNTSNTVFEATLAPPNVVIPQHREMGYLPESKSADRVSFYCHIPSETGGQTPITDFEAVHNDMMTAFPKEMERLTEEGLDFHSVYWNSAFWRSFGFDMWGWQQSFDCDSTDTVDAIIETLGGTITHYEAYSCMHTHVPISTRHPIRQTQVMYPFLYYNRRTMTQYYHLTSAQEKNFRKLLMVCHNKHFDILHPSGDLISENFIHGYHQVVCRHTHTFNWAAHDCLLLDNNWLGHGRTAFSGKRDHWVSLSNAAS